jgi:hypothetical protein
MRRCEAACGFELKCEEVGAETGSGLRWGAAQIRLASYRREFTALRRRRTSNRREAAVCERARERARLKRSDGASRDTSRDISSDTDSGAAERGNADDAASTWKMPPVHPAAIHPVVDCGTADGSDFSSPRGIQKAGRTSAVLAEEGRCARMKRQCGCCAS